MRFFTGLAGVWLGTGLSLTGAAMVVGCGEDFDGCEASRTCNGANGGKGGVGGAAAGGAGSGGKGGNAGTSSGRGGSASGGKSGNGGAASGEAGEGGAGAAAGEAGSVATTGGMMGRGEGGAWGEAGSDAGPPVDDRPHVVETSPKNGEKGVLADTDIIVTFSEPMDFASTKAAYSSDDLPPDEVTISWLDNATLLIRPNEPLMYATVDSLEGDAKHYSFSIAGTATDLAGNALGDDHNYVFTTMRHISDTLTLPDTSYGRDLYRGTTDRQEMACESDDAVLHAGDNSFNQAIALVAAFNLTAIPDGVLTWDSARLKGTFTTTARNPFSRLGDLMAYSLEGELDGFDWNTETAGELAHASTNVSAEGFNVNVLEAMKREYEHRDEYPFSVLFRFEDDTDDDDESSYVKVPCDSVRLEIALTAP